MILVAYPDQRVSEEMTGNLYNALHLVNTVNMDPCILLKGFQDYKETPTPNILCMCTCGYTFRGQRSVSASFFIHFWPFLVSHWTWCLPTWVGLARKLCCLHLSRPGIASIAATLAPSLGAGLLISDLQAWMTSTCVTQPSPLSSSNIF